MSTIAKKLRQNRATKTNPAPLPSLPRSFVFLRHPRAALLGLGSGAAFYMALGHLLGSSNLLRPTIIPVIASVFAGWSVAYVYSLVGWTGPHDQGDKTRPSRLWGLAAKQCAIIGGASWIMLAVYAGMLLGTRLMLDYYLDGASFLLPPSGPH